MSDTHGICVFRKKWKSFAIKHIKSLEKKLLERQSASFKISKKINHCIFCSDNKMGRW